MAGQFGHLRTGAVVAVDAPQHPAAAVEKEQNGIAPIYRVREDKPQRDLAMLAGDLHIHGLVRMLDAVIIGRIHHLAVELIIFFDLDVGFG